MYGVAGPNMQGLSVFSLPSNACTEKSHRKKSFLGGKHYKALAKLKDNI